MNKLAPLTLLLLSAPVAAQRSVVVRIIRPAATLAVPGVAKAAAEAAKVAAEVVLTGGRADGASDSTIKVLLGSLVRDLEAAVEAASARFPGRIGPTKGVVVPQKVAPQKGDCVLLDYRVYASRHPLAPRTHLELRFGHGQLDGEIERAIARMKQGHLCEMDVPVRLVGKTKIRAIDNSRIVPVVMRVEVKRVVRTILIKGKGLEFAKVPVRSLTVHGSPKNLNLFKREGGLVTAEGPLIVQVQSARTKLAKQGKVVTELEPEVFIKVLNQVKAIQHLNVEVCVQFGPKPSAKLAIGPPGGPNLEVTTKGQVNLTVSRSAPLKEGRAPR